MVIHMSISIRCYKRHWSSFFFFLSPASIFEQVSHFLQMGVVRLFTPKTRFYLHSCQSLVSNQEMASFGSTQHQKDSFFLNHHQQSHYISSLVQNPAKGSLDFLSASTKHQKDPVLARWIHGGTVLDESDSGITDKLCKILSTHTGSLSRIESSLDSSGITTVSPALVEQVLKKVNNAGALALSFFRWAERKQGFRHTTESYNALIEALGKIKQFRLIWGLVDEMKRKGLLTKETFGLIMRRYARARKNKEAIDTFNKMGKFGMKLETSDFNRLIDTLSKSRHVKEAHQLFDEMNKKKRFTPDIRTYTILLEGWGEARNMLTVKEVYREMKDEGFEPDVVTYGIIINAYCKSRKYDEALEVVHEMEAKKCKLSPHIYCTLINGLGAANRLSEALEFFERSKKSGYTPEVPTYNAVVGSYCYSNKFREAFEVTEEMKHCGVAPNSRTYEIILHHLMKNRRTKEAYGIFQKMKNEYGCEPSLNTYTMIVRMFCNEERVDMALKVWNQMRAKGIVPSMHMFSCLINGLCLENRLDDACKYFQEMLDVGLRPPGQLYGNLKQVLLDAGKKDVAIKLGLKLDRIRRTPLVEEHTCGQEGSLYTCFK